MESRRKLSVTGRATVCWGGPKATAGVLVNPGESEDLIHRTDRYLEILQNEEKKARLLCELLEEMQKPSNYTPLF